METKGWWIDYPWRMVQTNLREIDMEDIDAAQFARSLKEYHATVVTLNAAGIIASYETDLDFQPRNPYLHGDSLNAIIDACHAEGIRVIARCDFSKISEAVYHQHPDWAYRKADGSVVNYNGFVQTCLNSDYQQKYIFEILKELFSRYNFDGLYCNMSGFMVVDYDYHYYGPCHCENCKRLFKEQFGGDIPEKDDMHNPMYGRYIAFKNRALKAQKQKLYQFIKNINPQIAVDGFDYQRIETNQDLDRPAWIYQASTNARRTGGIEKKKVCDGASVEFMGFQYRHSSISPALMEIRQWQNLANGTGTSLYIMGRLDNHRDRSGVNASQKAFEFFAAHEDVFRHLQSDADVLLVDKPLLARKDTEVCGWISALSQNHIAFDEVKLGSLTPDMLANKKIVILADTRFISDEAAAMLDAYVENGGTLLASGESGFYDANFRPRSENAIHALGIGAMREKKEHLKSTVFELKKEDAAVLKECSEKQLGYIVPGSEVIVAEIKDPSATAACLAMVPEQPYGPPEICYATGTSSVPGLLMTRYGRGMGIYIPWLAGTFYDSFGYANTFTFMSDVLKNLCHAQDLLPGTTPMVEVTLLKREGMRLLQLVNLTGCFGGSFFEPIEVRDLVLNVNWKGRKLRTLNGGHLRENGDQLILDHLNSYEAVEIIDGADAS